MMSQFSDSEEALVSKDTTKEDVFFTKEVIEAYLNLKLTNQVIRTNNVERRDIFIFDPSFTNSPHCHLHQLDITECNHWTGSTKMHPSRTIYDEEKNLALVSKVYFCYGCRYILGHSQKMASFSKDFNSKILFFHQCAISKQLLV